MIPEGSRLDTVQSSARMPLGRLPTRSATLRFAGDDAEMMDSNFGIGIKAMNRSPHASTARRISICLLGFAGWAFISAISPARRAVAQPSPPQNALADARSLEAKGEYKQAEEKYQAALKLSPSSLEARLGVGSTMAKLGQCQESEGVLKALAGSHRAETEQILGGCYFYMHDFDQAIVHLKLAREFAPKDQPVWITLGRAESSAGHNKEAISTLKTWLARNPQDQDALYWIGRIYNSMSQNVLDDMTAKDPNNYLVHELEGDQFRLKQDYAKALQAYQEALKAAPDAPGLHFNVGDVDYQMLKYPEAGEELQKELKINPYHALANFEMGDIDIKQGRVEDGMPYLERALKLDPNLAEAHRSMARALLAEKRYEDAVHELLWLTKADPTDHTAHAMLAGAYRQMGQMKEAQEEAEISQKLLQQRATELEHLKTEEQEINDRPSAPTEKTPQN
jgi:tetratricopeptide (TPR) repeat protein